MEIESKSTIAHDEGMKFFAAPCIAPTIASVSASTMEEAPEVAAAFRDAGVTGTFVVLDSSKEALTVHNAERAEKRFVLASTFKIADSLIGLDCCAVADVEEVLPFGGGLQFLKEWERGMSPRNASGFWDCCKFTVAKPVEIRVCTALSFSSCKRQLYSWTKNPCIAHS